MTRSFVPFISPSRLDKFRISITIMFGFSLSLLICLSVYLALHFSATRCSNLIQFVILYRHNLTHILLSNQ